MRVFLTITLIFLLSACGGGSDSSNSAPPPAPAPAPSPAPPPGDANSLTVTGPTQAMRNEVVGLAAMTASSGENYRFEWHQTAGPLVDVLASHSQAIGFEVTEPGDYTFEVTATHLSSAEVLSETHTFTVSNSQKTAQLRLDHAAVEQGRVSLRVDVPRGESINSLTWRQLSGPQITADMTGQDQFLFFTAPAVSNDSLIEIEVTITTTSGISDTDTALVLVKDAVIAQQGYFPAFNGNVVYNEMFPYHQDSAHADALKACVYNNTVAESCRFSDLPLIGQFNPSPTIDNVMDRVLVSHQWMGDRFKEYLERSAASPDMLALLRGVTAVVISYEVRPSFYWVATGAIYLDARNFWVTPQERDTLNDIPDFRSGFGNDLRFIMPWRYVKDGADYLNRSAYPQPQRLSRQFADVEADITWLMYHELAHANDFFPPDILDSLPLNASPLSWFNDNEARSTVFAAQFPLRSDEMKSLADVRFRGNAANDIQKAYQADDIQVFFVPDDAAMFYSYVSIREDYATLFERFMMAYRFNALADTAIMSKENNPDFDVTWGQRNRIMDPDIQPRTLYTVENIYPEIPAREIIAGFSAPQNMPAGTSWFDNLVIDGQRQKSGASRDITQGLVREHLHPLHTGRPGIPQGDK